MLNWKNRLLIRMATGFQRLAGVRSVRLDASTLCQLRCPSCPTGKGFHKNGVIGSGFLRLYDFKEFIDRSPKIRHIELSNYGEIFLNPDLLDIFAYAHAKKVHLTAFNGVNLNTADDDVLEGLVKFKVKGLTLSIDGASDETYAIYRKNGNFTRVIKNIEKINHYKKKYRSRWPILRWQFVIFGHNEHELPKAEEMARQLKTIFSPRFNWDASYSPVRNPEETRREIGKSFIRKTLGGGVEARRNVEKQPSVAYCTQFWCQPQINWDGRLLGCCVNHFRDYGNVFTGNLDELMAQEEYRITRDILLGKRVPDQSSPCFSCTFYEKLYPSFNRENPPQSYS